MKNTYLELPSHSPASRTIALTTVAMVAFTANSVLCRLAFTSASIDPATFTLVRLSSGTVRHCAPERKPTFAGLKLLERIWFWVGPWAEERTNFEAGGEYIRRPLIGDGAMSLIGRFCSLIPGLGVKLSNHPCRAHCSLRGRGDPSA